MLSTMRPCPASIPDSSSGCSSAPSSLRVTSASCNWPCRPTTSQRTSSASTSSASRPCAKSESRPSYSRQPVRQKSRLAEAEVKAAVAPLAAGMATPALPPPMLPVIAKHRTVPAATRQTAARKCRRRNRTSSIGRRTRGATRKYGGSSSSARSVWLCTSPKGWMSTSSGETRIASLLRRRRRPASSCEPPLVAGCCGLWVLVTRRPQSSI
mmetsp:Transcript_26063/g.65665  ORF Transcript_26063/g.65665 Transcript_26063/m.65665 type:complete len:211 (-) Transcript_26063:500-1132(-)